MLLEKLVFRDLTIIPGVLNFVNHMCVKLDLNKLNCGNMGYNLKGGNYER